MSIPVVLFVYNRPDTLIHTLESLKENDIPLLYVFSDAPKNQKHVAGVNAVRELIRSIDWSEVHIIERETNFGLGKSIMAGVSHVLKQHEATIVFEDDLVCAPGTYTYFVDALTTYRNTPQVMSITAWNNSALIPTDITNIPYLDGRAESWSWATWRRAWQGMETVTAMQLIREYLREGHNIQQYGDDIPAMCLLEAERNLWLIRWIMWHFTHNGLCLRPPHSMIEHIGYTEDATNSNLSEWLYNDPSQPLTIAPSDFPTPIEHPDCAHLWRQHRKAYWQRVPFSTRVRAGIGLLRRMIKHRFFYIPHNT